jgi:hypothetical protein
MFRFQSIVSRFSTTFCTIKSQPATRQPQRRPVGTDGTDEGSQRSARTCSLQQRVAHAKPERIALCEPQNGGHGRAKCVRRPAEQSELARERQLESESLTPSPRVD